MEATARSALHPTGMIDEDGRFVVHTNFRRGAPAGTYRVVVMSMVPPSGGGAHPIGSRSLVAARYSNPHDSPLSIDVSSANPSANLVWELQR